MNTFHSGNIDSGGKSIIGGLTHIDVVIGMNGILTAHFSSKSLDGPVGDHFIEIHIGLGSAAGLPHYQGEMVIQFSSNHLIRSIVDSYLKFFIQAAKGVVNGSGGFFKNAVGPDKFPGKALITDFKIV